MNRCLALCLAALLAGCTSPADKAYAKLWPEGSLEAIESATGVLVWRIDPRAQEEDRREDLHGHGYLGGPVSVVDHDTLGKAWLKSLYAILRNPESYAFENPKACAFMPGFMVQYEGPQGSEDVLFCFSCDELDRHWKGKSWIGDFTPARAALWELMRQVFPDDPVFHGEEQ